MKKISAYKTAELEPMNSAGQDILDCYRVLQKSKANIVGEVIKGSLEFFEWDHYPKGDVYDKETHAQYYYHAHPSEERIARLGEEHGHFHTFVRPLGMPSGVHPASLPDYKKPEKKNDDVCHLVGIAMDRKGLPIRLFTVNRWVTGETWYNSEDVLKILDRFTVDLAYPSWPVNIWITSLLRLFRPQIEELVQQRDLKIAEHQHGYNQQNADKDNNAYEDRSLEVTSYININVDVQIDLINKELKRRAKG